MVNKIDRPAARPDWVVDSTFELFMDLGATDEQCEFPVVYASGVNGIAGHSPDSMAETLVPLFETIVKEVSQGLLVGSINHQADDLALPQCRSCCGKHAHMYTPYQL